ncbi:hypothetical protein PL75_04765 [Neisseria arctica]|uniref:AlpA family transcriptional regulator n=1 Tax=Neisseria arctica TaxID=1470200 RepID=A0A0J0YSY0_9NEIS|nr:AlpA family phage regulatory protein [Neisseria arctica]KLT73211.1 hypothetical protein PL75_04765 [Neisseria arctica]UOO87052.1 AlpA family phage regulatory protein [Neisseria arctica]
MADAILRQLEVRKRLGNISSSALWYRLDPKSHLFDPDMPKPFKLSANGRSVGWLESEIDAYIEKRAAVRLGA